MPGEQNIPVDEHKKEEVNESKSLDQSNELSTDIQQNDDTMEVHKHPHHVTHKKKWGEYLLEFFMLFLAVTAGFFAENFREHLSNNVTEREYMRSLIRDLKSDTDLINGNIRYNTLIYKSDSSLLYLLNNPANDSLIVDTLFKKATKASNFWVDFNDPKTFEQLKSTGDFRLIKNKIVLENISNYYQQVSSDKIFRDEIQSQLQITYNLADKIFDEYTFVHNRSHLTKPVTADLQLIKEYSNKLYHLINEYKEFIRHMGILKQKADEFISVIRQEYHVGTE